MLVYVSAAMASVVAGWLTQDLAAAVFGDSGGLLASLVASTVAFVMVRRWLITLKDG